MDSIWVLIVVIGILTSIASKKRKAAEKKKAQQQFPLPSRNPPNAKPAAPSKPVAASRQATPSAAPGKTSSRGVDSKWPWPTAEERAQNKTKPAAGGSYSGTPRYTHVVTSTLEGGHTHTESSMTGEEACPPPKAVPMKPAAAVKDSNANAGLLLSFEPGNVLQGVLFSEILGKPKSLQRN